LKTRYFIMSKAGLLRVSDRRDESWDNPYVFLFGIVVGLNAYFIAKFIGRGIAARFDGSIRS
jgi:hypothetical protein